MSTWKRKIWLGTFLVAAMAFSAACTAVPASAPVSDGGAASAEATAAPAGEAAAGAKSRLVIAQSVDVQGLEPSNVNSRAESNIIGNMYATLYDVSEIAIPLDRVAAGETATPQTFDLAFVRRFMFVFGPLSSLFDLATFATLYFGFHAGEAVFRTAWFVESIATQVLVIFVIRTRRSPFLRSTPGRAVTVATFAVVAVAVFVVELRRIR